MHSVSAPNGTWSVHDVAWTYRLGEIPLFRSRFRVLQQEGHFLERTEQGDPIPPVEGAGNVAGALIRSQVLRAPAPLVEFRGGLLRYRAGIAPRYWIDLTGTFAAYAAKFSSKTRQTLGRKSRKLLAPAGPASFRAYRTPEELVEFIRHARTLSAKTYQERLLGVGFPSDPAFHARILDRAREDRERGYLLLVGDLPIAYLYTPESHPGVLSYHSLGFDPDFEHFSPGTVLQYRVVEQLFGEGKHRIFDFGEGETEQKKLFATHHLLVADLYVLHPTLPNGLRVSFRVALESISSAIVWSLDRVGVKRWVKRLLRRRLVATGTKP